MISEVLRSGLVLIRVASGSRRLLVVFCLLRGGSTLHKLTTTFNNGTYISSLKNTTLYQIAGSNTCCRQLCLLRRLLQDLPQVENGQGGQAGQAQRTALKRCGLPSYLLRYMLAHIFWMGVQLVFLMTLTLALEVRVTIFLAKWANPHIIIKIYKMDQLFRLINFIITHLTQTYHFNNISGSQLHTELQDIIRYFMTKFPQKLQEVLGKQYINGELVSSKGNPFDVINPATEGVIGQAVAATQEDVNAAVDAARKAYNTVWRQTDAHQRCKIMLRIADLVQKNTEWLAYYESLNNGKPLSVCINEDIPFTAYMFRYFAGQADKIKGSTLQLFHPHIGMTIKEPVGVVGQIIPWNYPLLMMTWKIAPALAAGCTIVLKPAEQTPFTALMFGKLLNEAGLPAGVVNIVTGFGETGSFITTHKGIDKISFTGSTEVGYIIMRNSHKENLKPITLQLGGKSANIICADADLEIAVQQACSLFGNNGQSCIAGSRTYVHESIYDKFVEGCVKYAQGLKVGDPMDEDTQLGAIVSKEQFDRILYYIGEGVKEGAKVVTGGGRLGEKGYFVKPTVFANVQDHMRIAKEQIFGPVMSILKWSEQEDVINRANALPYGLGAGVVTPNIDRAIKFVKRLHAGTVYVNCYDYQEGPTPFGGYKDSGIGKDLGDEGVQSYLLTKTVIIKANNI